jgi:hypothetical protein
MANEATKPERTSEYGYSKMGLAYRGPNQYEYPTASTAREHYGQREEEIRGLY